MATVITNDKISKHSIDKYNFKVLAVGGQPIDEPKAKSSLVADNQNDEALQRRESDSDATPALQSSKDSIIESLMQKTDEMSSNFIKLQMKLESKEEEYKAELEKVKLESFNEGIEAGIKKAAQEKANELESGINQFTASVSKLENSAKEFERALEGIKGELVSAALDISKEVIAIELSKNSAQVAKVLGDELIKELQSASKVILKVNPKDHGKISEHVGSLEHIEVISDSAVSEGGVIAISDAGNIDAQISKRFERVKRAALSE